jgi:ATP-dependent Clp protease adaptor protein ClpS
MSQVILDPIFESEASQHSDAWMVVIYDNDTNSCEEVVMILMIATHCDAEEAAIEMWEAHTFGKASVHFSTKEECEEVASVIATIGVRCEVTKEWMD